MIGKFKLYFDNLIHTRNVHESFFLFVFISLYLNSTCSTLGQNLYVLKYKLTRCGNIEIFKEIIFQN